MARRKVPINLVPLLDIIMIFLLVFMVTADAETERKAEIYDSAIHERDTAVSIQKEYIEKYDSLFVKNEQILRDKEIEIANLKNEFEQKVERLQQDKADLLATVTSLSDEASMAKALTDKMNELIVQREKAERAKALLERRNNSLVEGIKSAQMETAQLANQMYELERNLEELSRELENKKKEAERLQKENDQLAEDKERHKKIQATYDQLLETHQNLREKTKKLDVENGELKKDLSTSVQANKDLKIQIAKLETENDVLREKNRSYQQNAAPAEYAEMARRQSREIDRLKELVNELKKELAQTGRGNLQEEHEITKLAEWAQAHFWIIQIWLDKEENGRQPYQISDTHNPPVNLEFHPKSVDECLHKIRNFIKDHKSGGRSEEHVVIKIKAHPDAKGKVVDDTWLAISKGGFERFRVEIIEDPALEAQNDSEKRPQQ